MTKQPNGWTGTAARSLLRAEKFLVLQTRYQTLVIAQGLAIPKPIGDILARVPVMGPGMTSSDYLVKVRDAVTWPDVDAIEEAVITVLPSAQLSAQLVLQRLTYSQTVAADEYARYEKSMIDLKNVSLPPSAAAADQIRAELLSTTQRVKYVLEFGPPKEEARARLATSVIGTMSIGIVLISAAYIGAEVFVSSHGNSFIPPEAVFVVLGAGLVGGFISVQQRLQEPTNVDPLYKWLELDASGKSLLLSPVIGMIFALVLYVIMMGGFVTGSFFPTFLGCTEKDFHCAIHDFASFTRAATPADPVSWAKLTVWAFAAGFLERLVPDILTRIAMVAKKA